MGGRQHKQRSKRVWSAHSAGRRKAGGTPPDGGGGYPARRALNIILNTATTRRTPSGESLSMPRRARATVRAQHAANLTTCFSLEWTGTRASPNPAPNKGSTTPYTRGLPRPSERSECDGLATLKSTLFARLAAPPLRRRGRLCASEATESASVREALSAASCLV